jgi:hypothetical protein
MRKCNYEEYRKELKERYYLNFGSLATVRPPGRRKRKPADLDVLLETMIARKKRWVETGKLVELGARKYKLAVVVEPRSKLRYNT